MDLPSEAELTPQFWESSNFNYLSNGAIAACTAGVFSYLATKRRPTTYGYSQDGTHHLYDFYVTFV